jgi:hypothetical protein
VTTNCNLQANIDVCTWWKEARKWIPTYISRLRNDKSTAMKWAFLGTYSVVPCYKNRGVANKYDLLSNIDWLTMHAKIQQERFKDIVVTVDYSMNEVWQQGRRNTKMYEIFFDNFLPCVIKKSVFDRQVCVATNDKTLCTVSDEAFALLLLENSFDRWLDIYRLRKGQVTPKRGQKRREFESDVPTKYTKGGFVYNQTDKNNDPKGWNASGIKRYNELFEIVRKDRKTHKTFTVKWLAKRRAKLLEVVQTRKRKRPQEQARIELLDSEDDDSGNESTSANIDGENESGTELSDNEND